MNGLPSATVVSGCGCTAITGKTGLVPTASMSMQSTLYPALRYMVSPLPLIGKTVRVLVPVTSAEAGTAKV